MTDEAKAKRSDLTCLLWVLGGFATLGVGVLVALFTFAAQQSSTFNCRAKQAEAKTYLASIATMENAFASEYGSFSTDLVSLPFSPDGSPLYLYGFGTASTDQETELRAQIPEYEPTRMSTDDPKVIGDPPRFEVSRMSKLTRPLLPPTATATKDRFTAAAVGNLDADATLDVWTIDETRTFTNLVNDCLQ